MSLKELENKAVINLKQYCVCCYVALVTYSNYLEIVSTVSCKSDLMFVFNTVILYHYTINTWYNISSTWFLDIRISICCINLICDNFAMQL